jgi:hypothetical protein
MVGAGAVLAQTTNLPTSVFDSGTGASGTTFWRGDGTWASTLTASYTPAALGTALRAWYEMDHLTGSAGSSQSVVPDHSGNGFDLTQGTLGQQGTLALANQNGLNTLRFTYLNNTEYPFNNAILSGSTAGSMYMVYKVVSTANSNSMMAWGSAGSGSYWPYLDANFYIDFGSTTRWAVGVPTASVAAAYHIISVYSDTNDWALYVDGGTGGSSGGTSPLFHSASNTVGWNASTVYLGALGTSGSTTDGWIAEVYFTNAHQSTADRQKNEGYLAWKWGLTGNLDPSHPYKSVAPTAPGGGMMTIGGSIGGGTPGGVLYVGSGSVLAEDSTNFSWDESNYHLHLPFTGGYFLGGVPGLYTVQNTSGNNWFEGNSGNLTLTGYANFGTGDSTLASLTSGYNNTCLGISAMFHATSAHDNFAFGTQTLYNNQSDSYNTAVGALALGQLGNGGAGAGSNIHNVAIGYGAIGGIQQGSGNVGVGFGCMGNVVSPTTALLNVVIGEQAGSNLGTGGGGSVANNIFIGAHSGGNLTGATSNNTWLGSYQGKSALAQFTVAISDGTPNTLFDWNLTTGGVWSMAASPASGGIPNGLHIYHTQTALGDTTNYERAILDWNPTANVFRIGYQSGGSGALARLIAIDGFQKAGAPAAGDLPSGTMALINDTSGGATWLCYNAAGTIRKVQLT